MDVRPFKGGIWVAATVWLLVEEEETLSKGEMKGVILALQCFPSFGFPSAIQRVFSLYGVRHKTALGIRGILLSQDTSFILLDLLNSYHCPGSSLQLPWPAHWPRLPPPSQAFPTGVSGSWAIGNALALTPKPRNGLVTPAGNERTWKVWTCCKGMLRTIPCVCYWHQQAPPEAVLRMECWKADPHRKPGESRVCCPQPVWQATAGEKLRGAGNGVFIGCGLSATALTSSSFSDFCHLHLLWHRACHN